MDLYSVRDRGPKALSPGPDPQHSPTVDPAAFHPGVELRSIRGHARLRGMPGSGAVTQRARCHGGDRPHREAEGRDQSIAR